MRNWLIREAPHGYFSHPYSGSALVIMMKPAEYRNGLDAAFQLRRSGNGLLLGESLMRARLVVETRELGHETSKVRLAKDENVVQQLSP
jgi:hypothetical protein